MYNGYLTISSKLLEKISRLSIMYLVYLSSNSIACSILAELPLPLSNAHLTSIKLHQPD